MAARRYRLLHGQHIQTEPDGREVTYVPGQTFLSEKDMLRFNGDGMTPKFEWADGPSTTQTNLQSVSDADFVAEAARRGFDPHQSNTGKVSPPFPPATTTPPVPPPIEEANLRAMNVDQLKALAAEEEIDLKGAKSKEEMIKAIRASTAGPR